jgi:hypothetical protein
VEASSTGGQGSQRAVVPSDDDDILYRYLNLFFFSATELKELRSCDLKNRKSLRGIGPCISYLLMVNDALSYLSCYIITRTYVTGRGQKPPSYISDVCTTRNQLYPVMMMMMMMMMIICPFTWRVKTFCDNGPYLFFPIKARAFALGLLLLLLAFTTHCGF